MVKSPTSSASATPTYEPERLYELTLTRVVEGPNKVKLSPAHRTLVKGKHIAALGDAVKNARAV